jgi:hypothetical protein
VLEEANGSTNVVGLVPSVRPCAGSGVEIAAEQMASLIRNLTRRNVCAWRHRTCGCWPSYAPEWLLRRGSVADTIDAEAKDLATKQLARFAAREIAKKATLAAEPAEGQPKPAPAPLTETPAQLRARVRASLLRRTA